MSLIIPEKLVKGDRIGVIAPAGQLQDKEPFIKGISILKEMGFIPIFPENLWAGHGYLADSDENRSYEFNQFWKNQNIKCLIAMRGGFGSVRMVGDIDKDIIKEHPKFLMGFSDITVLTSYLYSIHSLLTLHGPVITQLTNLDEGSLERFYLCLTGNWDSPIKINEMELLKKGITSPSPLVGGNLSTLITLIGTPYDLNYADKVLFLEDVNEPSYKIDRMLTHLKISGKLDKLKGIILGDFNNEFCIDKTSRLRHIEDVWGRILEITTGLDFPIIANFPGGHGNRNYTLPMGAPTIINSDQRTIEFRRQ